MSTFEPRHELRKAVVRLAHAEGRTQTMERLQDLEGVARAWRERLNVEPKRADMVETCRDREFTRQAA